MTFYSVQCSPAVTLLCLLIQTPLRPQGFVLPLRLSELQGASLLGDGGAFLLRSETGHQLGDQPAGFLRVEVTGLLGDIDQSVHLAMM